MQPAYRYRATTSKVHDGDTFTAVVDLGFRVATTISVRVRGVDTPEMHDKDEAKRLAAQAAQRFTQSTLADRVFLLESYKDRESFARWVCDVWVDDANLSDLLIAAGHGVPMIR